MQFKSQNVNKKHGSDPAGGIVPRGGQQRGIFASPTAVVTYTDRMGDSYYLHEGKTKAGKVRYFVAKTIREGVLSAMPDGFEFSESINGVVSVRKTDTSAPRLPEVDLATARAEMASHAHLRSHRIEVIKGEIVIFESTGGVSAEVMAAMSHCFFTPADGPDNRVGGRRVRVRYTPVMKFVPFGEPGGYRVHRMTYRGNGGWSWPLASGSIHKLLKRYLRHVGTDAFFELH